MFTNITNISDFENIMPINNNDLTWLSTSLANKY